MTDPVADLLTRTRNANAVRHEVIGVPSSNMKKAVVNILLQGGHTKELEKHNNGVAPMLRTSLKYSTDKERIITGTERISKPGPRVYCEKDEIPEILSGLGIAITSTSTGLLVDREAGKAGLGGEVVRYV